MSQIDLFTYPRAAGWKEPTTSRDAALRIQTSGRAESLRQACLRELAFPHTAKEVAEILGEEITSVRPRFSELLQRQLIQETGLRRERQHVYQAVTRQ